MSRVVHFEITADDPERAALGRAAADLLADEHRPDR
jgi:hypothetical protein